MQCNPESDPKSTLHDWHAARISTRARHGRGMHKVNSRIYAETFFVILIEITLTEDRWSPRKS